jgi:hypothetical protein
MACAADTLAVPTVAISDYDRLAVDLVLAVPA